MKTILLDTSIDYTSWDINEAGSIEMTDWQPIDTAPKDGTDIIVMYMHINTQIVHAAFWMEYEEGLDDPDIEGWWSYVWSEVSRTKLDGSCSPTHWMPLPPDP